MRILPELEAYRDRLTAKASSWAEASGPDLQRELSQCRTQVELLERAVADLRARLEAASVTDTERISHRLSIQEQTRELTAAYAEALRLTLEKRANHSR